MCGSDKMCQNCIFEEIKEKHVDLLMLPFSSFYLKSSHLLSEELGTEISYDFAYFVWV